MNILLWVLQVALALFCFAGGAYKNFQFEELAKAPAAAALSRAGWGAIGVFEMLCAILLVVPAATKWMPVLTPRYSRKLTAANPLVWVVGMGLVAAFVAYGRYALRPLA